MLTDELLTVGTLLRKFFPKIGLTWALTLCETVLMALVPLLIGMAIDGLLNNDPAALLNLAVVLAALILISVIRRVYDTRVYGTIRVSLGGELVERSGDSPVSTTNARLDMGRELVDFLEEQVPALMNSAVQLVISVIILYSFHPTLSYAALGAGVVIIVLYGLFHRRFFRLNADLNHQTEQQVGVLEAKSSGGVLAHLTKLRQFEVRISDTEAGVYGAIFTILLGFIIFNLWFAAGNVVTTVGTIFAIVSYSWEFADSALILPTTLQGWSRLSEIMERINQRD